jgi:hypothetical protein
MKIVIIMLISLSLTGCSFFEPSSLIIKNASNYQIDISTNIGSIKELSLEKGKGEFIMSPPGNLKLSISINEINFEKTYEVKLEYLEKKKFEFNLAE